MPFRGRPPIYSTQEEMLPQLELWEQKILDGEQPTITGLCIALGFESKDTLYAYRDKPEFSYLIKQALLIVENGYEKMVVSKAPVGSIFVLKNMGWKDKNEIEHSGGLTVNITELPPDDINEPIED